MLSACLPLTRKKFLIHQGVVEELALPPLVVVDTNILVDALVDKIAQNLELASETSLDSFEHDNFHKVLLNRADSGRINLWLPSIVRHEITQLSKAHARLRASSNPPSSNQMY